MGVTFSHSFDSNQARASSVDSKFSLTAETAVAWASHRVSDILGTEAPGSKQQFNTAPLLVDDEKKL